MKIEALDVDNLKEIKLFKEKTFEILGNFIVDSKTRLLKEIKITIKNPDPKQKYEYISGNFCLRKIDKKLDVHAVEINLIEKNNPNTNATSIKPINNEYIILNNGTTLVFSPQVYAIGEQVEKCKFSVFEWQPETKDGAVVVSI